MASNPWESGLKTRVRFYWFIPYANSYNPGQIPDPVGLYRTELWVFAVRPGRRAVEREKDWPHVELWTKPATNSKSRGVKALFQVIRPLGGGIRMDGGLETFPPDGLPELAYCWPEGPFPYGAPALVIATVDLPASHEYVAFAHVKNRDNSWGAWHRVAQSRLDFVDEEGRAVVDLEVSDHRPKIHGKVTVKVSDIDTKSTSIPRAKVKPARIWVEATVDSDIPLTGVFINGQNNASPPQLTCPASASFPVSEACPQVHVVAENLAGNRCEAVKTFLPTYDEEGRVTSYDAENGDIGFDDDSPHPRKYRLRYHGIPYVPRPFSAAHVLSGNRTAADEVEFTGGGIADYFGPPCEAPANDLGGTPVEGDLLVPTASYQFGITLAAIDQPGLGLANTSDDTVLVRRNESVVEALEDYDPSVLGLNVLAVNVGERVQAHVFGTDEEFDVTVEAKSPETVAAGLMLVSDDSSSPMPLPRVKTGDVVRVLACDSATDCAEQKNGADAGMKASLTNEADDGTEDTTARDEPEAKCPTKTLGLSLVFSDHPPVRAEDSPQGPACCGSGTKPPGWVRRCLVSKEAVRLVTQDDRPEDNSRKHQILPNGRLRVETDSLNLTARVPCLEIIRRWRINGEPSVQPAFAGTSRRVGGPGTHRVGGLHHKLDDGSVYIHNGEFFQAAEDLFIKGKMQDLVFRRVHLSHSLFTTDIGRNWDWMGNMRAVEMLNGDVLLMNGEAVVEQYILTKSTNDTRGIKRNELVKPITVTNLKKGEFDYGKLWDQRRYQSPPGVYRSLIKAKPVEIDGMAVPDEDAEDARLYLVGKHGMIWTFVEDVRFHSNADVADVQSNDGESTPGVRAQYLLVSIHHRNQTNVVKLQRDTHGVVDAIIDDMGRVTRLVHNKTPHASADWFLTSVKDFAGREIKFIRPLHNEGDPRDLAGVDGPLSGRRGVRYDYLTRGTGNPVRDGPTHRLKAVVAPRESSHEDSEPYLEVAKWDAGRVRTLEVRSIVNRLALQRSGALSKLRNCRADGTITYVHEFDYKDNDLRVIHSCRTDSPSRKTAFTHVYVLRRCGTFNVIASQEIRLSHAALQGGARRTKALTKYDYNEHGELIVDDLPSGGQRVWEHVVSGSETGNLIRAEAFERGAREPAVSVKHPVEGKAYNRAFNLPEKTVVLSYTDHNKYFRAITTRSYDECGNLKCVTEPAVDITRYNPGEDKRYPSDIPKILNAVKSTATFEYRSEDGQLLESTSKRGVKTRYYYFDAWRNRCPGDAHDRAGMLAMIQVKPVTKYSGKTYFSDTQSRVEARRNRKPNDPRDTDLNTIFRPSLLGDPEVTIDANGYSHLQSFNELSQVLKDRGVRTAPPTRSALDAWKNSSSEGIRYEYSENDETKTVIVPEVDGPDGAHAARRVTRTCCDSLGNVVATCVERDGTAVPEDLVAVARHNVWGDPTFTIDEAGVRTDFTYDERGLMVESTKAESIVVLSIQITDELSEATERYDYDLNGNLVLHTDAVGWCEAWAYNEVNQLVRSLSRAGLITRFELGHGGQVWCETAYELDIVARVRDRLAKWVVEGRPDSAGMAALKQAIACCASTFGNLATYAAGRVYSSVSYWRDERGNVIRQSRLNLPTLPRSAEQPEAKKAVLQYVFSNDDLPLAEITQKGVRRRIDYDTLGRPVRESLGPEDAPYVTSRTFDGNGNALTVRTSEDTLTNQYDAFGNLVKTDSANLRVTTADARYYLDGTLLRKRVLPQSKSQVYQEEVFSYDAGGRLHINTGTYSTLPVRGFDVPAAVRQTTTWRYAANGRLERIETTPDSLGGTTQVVYEQTMHGPKRTTLNGLDIETDVIFDAAGNKTEWTDANGTRFVTSHDPSGQVYGLVAAQRRGGQTMHRRTILCDAAAHPVASLDRQMRHYTAAGSAVASAGIGAMGVLNVLAYGTLGHTTSETQSFVGADSASLPPPRTITFLHTPTGGRAQTVLPDGRSRTGDNLSQVVMDYTSDVLDRPISMACPTDSMARWGPGASLTYHPYDGNFDELTVVAPSAEVSMPRPNACLRTGTANATRIESTGRVGGLESRMGGQNNGARYARTTYPRWGIAHAPERSKDTVENVGIPSHVIQQMFTGTETVHKGPMPNGFGVVSEHADVATRLGTGDNYIANVRSETTSRRAMSSGIVDRTTRTTEEKDGNTNGNVVTRASESNTYSQFGSAQRLPTSVTAEGVGKPAGADDSNTRAILRYGSGSTASEPNPSWSARTLFVARDVFGQTVRITRGGPGAETCQVRYDAFGRQVLKDVPASVAAPDPVNTNTVIIEIKGRPSLLSKPIPRPGATAAFERLYEAVDWIRTQTNSQRGIRCTALTEYLVEIGGDFGSYEWNTLAGIMDPRESTYSPSGRNTRVPKYRFERITFIKVANWSGSLGDVVLPRGTRCVTLKGLTFSSLEIDAASSLVIDGCSFEREYRSSDNTPLIHIRGACPGLQVQNCTLKSPRCGIRLQDIRDTTVLIAHNLFDSTGRSGDVYHAIEYIVPQTVDSQLRVSVGVLNNIFIMAGANDRAFFVSPEQAIQRGLFDYIWLFGDHNLYYGLRNWTVHGAEIPKLPGDRFGSRYGCALGTDTRSVWLDQSDRRIDLPNRVRTGHAGAGLGYPGVPGMLSMHSPVLWDRNGRLRDPKNPTIGPIELNVPGTGDRVVHRYVHDGGRPAVRESYRYTDAHGNALFSRSDVTRFLPVNPSGPGPVVYSDDDGVVDVDFTDRDGRPWFWYRAREGMFTVPTYPGAPASNLYGFFDYLATTWDIDPEMRNTAMLRPLNLAESPYFDFVPWHARVLEPDVLTGRRGVAGWDGLDHDRGLRIDLDVSSIDFWARAGSWVFGIQVTPEAEELQRQAMWEYRIPEPGLWGWVPVVGSAWEAAASFERGRWGWGIFHSAMTALDVFILTSLAKKLVVKTGVEIVARGTAEATAKAVGSQALRQASSAARAGMGFGRYAARAAGRVALRTAGGYVGGLAIGTTQGLLQGEDIDDALELGHAYGRIGAALSGVSAIAYEALRVVRYGRTLWHPGGGGYRPPSFIRDLLTSFYEPGGAYPSAGEFRRRWMLVSGRRWPGHHWAWRQKLWKGVEPLFPRGTWPNKVLRSFGNAGMHIQVLPRPWHTRLFHSGSATYRSIAGAASVGIGYGALVTTGVGSVWSGTRIGDPVWQYLWEGVFDE